MKQRRIKELTINHYEQGSSVAYTPSRAEEYAAVLAQAEAHQDLRFQYNDKILILPWETVAEVYAYYKTEDVAAPYDAICGGCEHPGFHAEFKPYDSVCATYVEDEDPVRIVTFTVNGVEHSYNDPEKWYTGEELADVIEVMQDCKPVDGWTAKFYIEPDSEHDGKYLVVFDVCIGEECEGDNSITINNVAACQ